VNEPGPQFIKLYRGINFSGREYDPKKGENVKKSRDTNFDRVGIHWSDDKSAAERWAVGNGTVLEAYVHKKHVVPRDTSEFDIYAKRHKIYGYDEGEPNSIYPPEKEITLRKDSPVHIMSSTEIKSSDRRTRRKTKRFKAPIGGLT
jgi:hypothetical protein